MKNLKYFKFRADFRKKSVQKRGQKGDFGGFGGFSPVLPYFACFTLFWATSWGAATKSGMKGWAARPEGRAAMGWFGAAVYWGPATSGEWRDPTPVRCSTNFGNGDIVGNGVTPTPNLP